MHVCCLLGDFTADLQLVGQSQSGLYPLLANRWDIKSHCVVWKHGAIQRLSAGFPWFWFSKCTHRAHKEPCNQMKLKKNKRFHGVRRRKMASEWRYFRTPRRCDGWTLKSSRFSGESRRPAQANSRQTEKKASSLSDSGSDLASPWSTGIAVHLRLMSRDWIMQALWSIGHINPRLFYVSISAATFRRALHTDQPVSLGHTHTHKHTPLSCVWSLHTIWANGGDGLSCDGFSYKP